MWIGHWHSEQLIAWDMKMGYLGRWSEQADNGDDMNLIISGMTTAPFPGDSLLLIASQHMGIRVFDMREKNFIGGFGRDIFVKYSLPTDFANYIYTDSRGILWVCTWNGLCKMNVQEQQFRTLEIPFLNTPMFQHYNLIEGIVQAESPDLWWLGVNGCGLIKYNTASKQMVRQLIGDLNNTDVAGTPGSWIEFLVDTKHGIWAGNDLGIVKIEGDKALQYEIPASSWKKTISVAPDGTFWIASNAELIHFDPVSGNQQLHSIDSSLYDPLPIRSVIETGFCKGPFLWTGTVKGLFRFDTQTHESTRISLSITGFQDADVNAIHSLVTDEHELVYVGTPVGLGIYNTSTGEFALKGHDEHVYPIFWKSLLRDKAGKIWIYTPHALFRYDPRKDAFTQFTTSQGIHNFSSDPAHLFSFENHFYLGYRGAFTEFDPLKADINRTMVTPLITEVHIGDQPLQLHPDSFSNQTLTIPPGQNDLTFYFTGIDYTDSDKITFSYKLDTDPAWKESGTHRSVTYSHLRPGSYSLLVRARNSSGMQNVEPARFNFSIQPMFHQHWWFWPMIAVIAIAGVIAFAMWRVRSIRREEKRKTETHKALAQLETQLLRSQMNPHFIFNSLNSVQKYIWENKEEDAAEYLAQFAKLMRAILDNSTKESITLKEELDVLKLYIELEHRRSNGKFNYSIRVSEAIEPETIVLPPMLIQPYIENAIWHGLNKKNGIGQLNVLMEQKNRHLEIIIDDDGIGRSMTNRNTTSDPAQKLSHGTALTEQRLRHLKTNSSEAHVEIVDKYNAGSPAGTTVRLIVPVQYRRS
jgi:ligand-binding sensor domain-containing protein